MKRHVVVSVRGPSKRTERTGLVDLRLVLHAPGLSRAEVADYVRDAVQNYAGCLEGDDARRAICVEQLLGRAWADIDGDAPTGGNG